MKCIPFYHLENGIFICEPMCKLQTNTKNYYLSFQHRNFISFEFICVKFHLRCKMQKLVSILSVKLLKKRLQFTIHKQIHTLCTVHCALWTCRLLCILCYAQYTMQSKIKIQLSLFTKCVGVCARNYSMLPYQNRVIKTIKVNNFYYHHKNCCELLNDTNIL